MQFYYPSRSLYAMHRVSRRMVRTVTHARVSNICVPYQGRLISMYTVERPISCQRRSCKHNCAAHQALQEILSYGNPSLYLICQRVNLLHPSCNRRLWIFARYGPLVLLHKAPKPGPLNDRLQDHCQERGNFPAEAGNEMQGSGHQLGAMRRPC